mmetsp:Transcript_2255/g.2931  ORF Transcript_2255/g.2931 Transcript_2255/m.2931 type:complete len:106 (+) Transcript_2255:429-746(+)
MKQLQNLEPELVDLLMNNESICSLMILDNEQVQKRLLPKVHEEVLLNLRISSQRMNTSNIITPDSIKIARGSYDYKDDLDLFQNQSRRFIMRDKTLMLTGNLNRK